MNWIFLDSINWDYDVATPLERPLGGSQSGLCYLATALARRGHAVATLTATTNPREVNGVRCLSNAAIPEDLFDPADSIVVVLNGPANFGRQTMLNHEGSHPEHFEELCALAASGQISEPEFVELQDHLQQCARCRSTFADFIDLVHDKLPLVDPELAGSSRLPHLFSNSSSYRERFLARARKQGVAVSHGSSRDTVGSTLRLWLWPKLGHAHFATVAVAVLLVTVGFLGYSLYQSNVRYTRLAADKAALSKQLGQQSDHGSIVLQEGPSPSLAQPGTVPTGRRRLACRRP
jgi:hypothetical protein